MLEHKGIAYKRTDLLPGRLQGRRCGLSASPANTVPALKIDGDKVQGSRQIARELERLRPEPSALPGRPGAAGRGRGGRALRRRGAPAPDPPDALVGDASRTRRRSRSYSEGAKLGVPIGAGGEDRRRRSSPSRPASTKPATRTSAPTSRRSPGLLDRVDAWIESGVAQRRRSSTPPTSRSPPASAWR